jgi:hypothetical protein
VIQSICLTAKLGRWKPPTAAVFVTGDETTWDEEGERCHRSSIEEGPPLLEVEWNTSMVSQDAHFWPEISGLLLAAVVELENAAETPHRREPRIL